MTPPPINIDGTNENYSNVTIDGQDVTQITIDGQDVLSTIPDSGLLHWYAASELSGFNVGDTVDPFTDTEGTEDLAATNTPEYQPDQIGGEPAVVYTKSEDDFHSNTSFDSGFPSDPVHIWVVYEPSADEDEQGIFTWNDSGTDPNPYFNIDTASFDRYTVRDSGGNSLTGGSPDADPQICLIRFTGSDTEVAVNGSEIISGGSGTLSAGGMYIGTRDAGTGRSSDGPLPESLVYDPTDSGYSESDVESYLSDKYGITVS